MRVGFCVSGGGRLARAAIARRAAVGIEPALVVAERSASAELDGFCGAEDVPLVRLDPVDRTSFDAALTDTLVGAELDLVLLTFDRLLPAPLVASYRHAIVNVHPSLLPSYPGMRGLEQALAAGAPYRGATIHEVDEAVDHGPVLAQCVLGLRRGETASSAGRRLFGPMRLMTLQVLAWYAQGRVERDGQGLHVRDAVYGELPFSPAIEDGFPE